MKTRQDKTRQDKTRQDKTRQDKTRQDKEKRNGEKKEGYERRGGGGIYKFKSWISRTQGQSLFSPVNFPFLSNN